MNENAIFSNLLLDSGYSSFKKDDQVPAVIAEANSVATNLTFSPCVCLLSPA